MRVDFDRLVAIDVETTGTNPSRHEVLAIALAPLKAGVAPAVWYVRPSGRPWWPWSWSPVAKSFFKKYAKEWHASAAPPRMVGADIARYLHALGRSDLMLVGHNVGFDMSFLKKVVDPSMLPLSHRSVDTHTLLQSLHWLGRIRAEDCSSEGAFKAFGVGVPDALRHTALGDAVATKELFRKLVEELERIGENRRLAAASEPTERERRPRESTGPV